MAFVSFAVGLAGEVGSRVGEMCVYVSIRLCVGLFVDCVRVCALSLLLSLVGEICVLCGGLRRLPALWTSIVVGGRSGGVASLLGLGCLDRGVGKVVSFVPCSVVRFRLRWAGGVGVGLL